MKKGLLTFVAVGLLASVSRASDDGVKKPVGTDLASACNKVSALHERLVGRALGMLIRRGMTHAEVRSILGDLEPDRFQYGPFLSGCDTYTRYGLTIGWAPDSTRREHPWCVTCVIYGSLLGDD
jgi:hypothetical protein